MYHTRVQYQAHQLAVAHHRKPTTQSVTVTAYDQATSATIGDITITWPAPPPQGGAGGGGSFTIGPATALNVPLPTPYEPFTVEISAPDYQSASRDYPEGIPPGTTALIIGLVPLGSAD
ncbi:MAG: hypothetical protein KKA73_18280 [Chloroflexi bacterium]|nr:hypothetical protein [Chloroflexota bacterium]MBU1749635.1 hypothetical protein [Chloroflexota bacterium]